MILYLNIISNITWRIAYMLLIYTYINTSKFVKLTFLSFQDKHYLSLFICSLYLFCRMPVSHQVYRLLLFCTGVSTVDYSLYPDQEFQRAWLRVYLREFNALGSTVGNGTGEEAVKEEGVEPSKEEVERLLVLVNKFALASHFLWATWALVQAEHSTINFDYLGWVIFILNCKIMTLNFVNPSCQLFSFLITSYKTQWTCINQKYKQLPLQLTFEIASNKQ